MPSGTIPTPPPVSRPPAPPPLSDSPQRRLIDEQLDRTRAQVRVVDALFGVLAMAVGSLLVLLAAAVVDHWAVGFGVGARLAVCAVVAAWSAYCAWRWIVPALSRRINPLYAADAIERHQPSLKNSLINYLLVRSHPEASGPVVQDALERQAAADIARAPVDTAVDRKHVLRLGYALVAVVLAFALYKVASPKDPFQTVARVLAPLADIARPSRVTISSVTPAEDSEIFHGRHLPVTATIDGLQTGESPSLIYSTADGQTVDLVLPMTRSEDGLHWEGRLPPESPGAQQDFRYRVTAGDAVTRDYRVTVSPAPAIAVRRLEYVFPSYTRRAPQTIDDYGDISALEGTRVTVRAEANQPIQSAWMEFDPPVGGGLLADAPEEKAAPQKRLPMKTEDRSAAASFRLEWDRQAAAPRHRQYRVRFITADGHRNERPIVHAIDVQPDLPPEVEILEPRQNRIEVPENGQREIVVRAIDPDYGVSKITLEAGAGGSNLQLPELLLDREGRTGQIVTKHTFIPADHGLKAGDRVVYWARVEDNRAAPGQNTPEPNTARTTNYHLVITPPEQRENDASEGEKQEEKQEPPKGEDSGEDESEKSEDGRSGEGSGESGEGEKQEGGGQSGEEGSSGQGGMGEGEKQEGEPQEGEKGESTDEPGQGAGGGASSDDAGEGQEQSQSGGQGASSKGASGSQPQEGEGGQDGEASGNKQNAGEPREGGNPSGQGGAQGDDSAGQGGAGQDGDAAQQPLSPDGTQDREVIERIQKYLNEQQKSQGGQIAENAQSPEQSGDADGASDASSQSPSGNDPQASQSPQDAAQGKQPGDGKRPDQQQGEAQRGEAQGQRSETGEGGSPQGSAETRPEQGQPKDPAGAKPAPGQGDSGQSGAGAKSENPRGSPESQEQNQDRPKNSEGGDSKENDSGASSPSTSKKQSDSQGDTGGDRSGGGEQGGGQGAKQAGNDSPGSSSAADEGAGAAGEQGAGETGEQPGQQQLADRPTGQSSDTPGAGSGAKQNPQGDGTPQPSPAEQNSRPGQSPASPQNSPRGQLPEPSARGNRDGGGQHTFGAEPQGGSPAENDPQGEPPPAVPENADVNLDYARKATDLALETLRDQQDRPDDELLDQLGWTPEDMQRFLARWEAMKQAAAQQGPEGDEARQRLTETLESLGLRPENTAIRRGAVTTDEDRGLRDSGHRTAPPPEYRKLFEAYLKGAGRPRP